MTIPAPTFAAVGSAIARRGGRAGAGGTGGVERLPAEQHVATAGRELPHVHRHHQRGRPHARRDAKRGLRRGRASSPRRRDDDTLHARGDGGQRDLDFDDVAAFPAAARSRRPVRRNLAGRPDHRYPCHCCSKANCLEPIGHLVVVLRVGSGGAAFSRRPSSGTEPVVPAEPDVVQVEGRRHIRRRPRQSEADGLALKSRPRRIR